MDDISIGPGIDSEVGAVLAPQPNVRERLLEVQRDLKVAKSQTNAYGGYNYRSKEDILEAAKPLCHERGLLLLCTDDVAQIGGWVYVRSSASVTDAASGESVSAQGFAREPESRKGMDASQITGTASSYAGKRALGNLFALDDTQDSDSMPSERVPETGPFVARCRSCGSAFTFQNRDQYEAYVSHAGCCPNPDWHVDA